MKRSTSLRLNLQRDQLIEHFHSLSSPRDVAHLLDVPYEQLVYHLYRVSPGRRYSIFNIRKRYGGERKICAPAGSLKIIQRKLNQVLQAVYKPKPSVHGAIGNRSIVSNALNHARKRLVYNVDLADFFPSLNFGRVRGMFMALPYERNSRVATVLAQICCHQNMLPQGAPTSPIVANMICSRLDTQLQQLAKRCRCTYTRYFDDITFSTTARRIPRPLARFVRRGEAEAWIAGDELNQIIASNGFAINQAKLRVQPEHVRQEVTGLTTNRRVNVRRKLVRQVRAMLHAWEKFGYEDARREFLEKYDRKHRATGSDPPSFEAVVRGKIEFLGMVRGKGDDLFYKFLREFNRLTGRCQPEETLNVFISYAHKDERLRKNLGKHLASLSRQKLVDTWTDRKITAGEEWRGAIDENLGRSRVVLLLVSSDFLDSDYCMDIEMKRALEMHEAGQARVIPVILRPCDWSHAPFAKLLALPTDGKPITKWNPRDDGYLSVAEGIREAITEGRRGRNPDG